MKKILAVASIGGHWIQLLRIAKGLEEEYDVSYMSTHEKCGLMVKGHDFHRLPDFNRWNAWRLFPAFFFALNTLGRERPNVVISTGAAPGLIVVFAAFCLGKKTIWVDSIANVAHLSFCGKIAKRFVSRFYTQWEELSGDGICFAGNVIG